MALLAIGNPCRPATLFMCWCLCLTVSVVCGLRRLPTALNDPGLQRLDIPAVFLLSNEDDRSSEPEDAKMKEAGMATAAQPQFQLLPPRGSLESSGFVRRLWGVPDAVAQAGLQFTLTLPADAFTGHVTQYQLSLADGSALPSWLHFDAINRCLEGKPTPTDVGLLLIQVKAQGDSSHDVDTDNFALEVLPAEIDAKTAALEHAEKNLHHAHMADAPCENTPPFLYVVLDVAPDDLKAKQKEGLLRSFAKYLQVAPDQVSLSREDTHMSLVLSGDALDSGPGHSRKQSASLAATLLANLPCESASSHIIIQRLKTDAPSPTLSRILGFPVLGWHTASTDAETLREKRQATGSGDADYEDEGDYEYDPDLDQDLPIVSSSEPVTRAVPTLATPVFLQPSRTPVLLSSSVAPTLVISASHPLIPSYIPTPALIPVRPTRLIEVRSMISAESSVDIEPTPVLVFSSSSATTSSSEVIQPTPVLVMPTPVVKEIDFYGEDEDEEVDEENEVGEDEVPPPKNSPPTVLKKLSLPITAGKLHIFPIPSGTFQDNEDGSTRNLKLTFTKAEGQELDENSWITFKPETQEIIALPLEEEIGKWNFRLTATDSQGASVSELMTVSVRQHAASRVFHHTITLSLEPDTKVLHTWLDWAMRTIKGLATMMGDMDTEAVLVRKITIDPPSLAFTNDTLPRQHCPEDLVQDLYDKLSNEGDATDELEEALAPELAATNVSLKLEGVCEPQIRPPTAPPISNVFPKGPAIPDKEDEPANHVPVWRNPVDYADAEVGRLLRFQVKDDACWDEEDGATHKLRLELLAGDRTALQPAFWLQFDSANREFYGLPMEDDVGSHELQLVCMDSAGATATDGLVIDVKPRPETSKPVVEFSLRVDVDYEAVQNSAQKKVRLIETLAELFQDSDPTHLVVHTIRPGSTVISWTNASLATDACPQADIQALRKQLFDEEERLTAVAIEILSRAAFPPLSASLIPLGACLGELTPTHGPEPGVEAVPEEDDNRNDNKSDNGADDYLLTFIVPGIIIACMLLLAGLIACVLYRRRRSGKMRLDERQGKSFLSKGIPVIFAEELEERPSAPVSSPLILKEEKSPRAGSNPPPNYPAVAEQRQLLRSPPDEEEDNGPYSPPPPLAANSNNKDSKGRPKATPAYRKPPPYVPP